MVDKLPRWGGGNCQNYSKDTELPCWPLQQLVDARLQTPPPTEGPSGGLPEYLVTLQRKETGTHPEVYSYNYYVLALTKPGS